MPALCCLLTILALVGCADSVQRVGTRQPVEPIDRRLAITFDDLPWVMLRDAPPADLASNHARLLAALEQAHVPLIGFVNEGLLYQDDALQPERVQMLRDWLDAGFELGNHTRWHSDLHAVGVDAYEADILAGEQLLRPLLAARGSSPRWFRHPYLPAMGVFVAFAVPLGVFLARSNHPRADKTAVTIVAILAATLAFLMIGRN